MYAIHSYSYTYLILAMGIVRKPTVWVLLLQNILAHMTLARLVEGGCLAAAGVTDRALEQEPGVEDHREHTGEVALVMG